MLAEWQREIDATRAEVDQQEFSKKKNCGHTSAEYNTKYPAATACSGLAAHNPDACREISQKWKRTFAEAYSMVHVAPKVRRVASERGDHC